MYVANKELHEILKLDESEQVDFKSGTLLAEPKDKNKYKIAKHMVGFANNKGGKLIFGVDDEERSPEGMNLVEEGCLRTISEITSDWCSPVIDFSHQFFSESADDLSKGSVFVLNVGQRDGPAPIALIEDSEGEIRKREYRIRSGESTRLVPDSELLHLFRDSLETEAQTELIVAYMHHRDLEPVGTVLSNIFPENEQTI